LNDSFEVEAGGPPAVPAEKRAGEPNLSRKHGSDERNDNAGDEHLNYCAQEEQKHSHILLSSILSSKQVAALNFT